MIEEEDWSSKDILEVLTPHELAFHTPDDVNPSRIADIRAWYGRGGYSDEDINRLLSAMWHDVQARNPGHSFPPNPAYAPTPKSRPRSSYGPAPRRGEDVATDYF